MNSAETFPLPQSRPAAQAHERIRDMHDRDKRMTESDGEVEAAVTLEFLVRASSCERNVLPLAHIGSP